MNHELVELARIALASKIDNSKSSTSLVYFILLKQIRKQVVGNKQNPHVPFSDLFRNISPKNLIKLFSCLTPSSVYEKSTVRWLRA